MTANSEPQSGGAISSSAVVRCHSLTTPYRQENPQPHDTFERWQVMEYLEHIPLGERTEADHKAICQFIHRARCHFAELDTQWQPSND